MYRYKAEVVRVIDGDTVDLIVDLGFSMRMQERFRLYGINTPETRTRDLEEKAAGIRAKQYLIARLSGVQSLQIETHKDKKGKFGRYLCSLLDVSEGGDININRELVRKGYAEEYMI